MRTQSQSQGDETQSQFSPSSEVFSEGINEAYEGNGQVRKHWKYLLEIF